MQESGAAFEGRPLSPAWLAENWEVAGPIIFSVLDVLAISAADLGQQLVQGRCTCHGFFENEELQGLITVGIQESTEGRSLCVSSIAGDGLIPHIPEMQAYIDDLARAELCPIIEMYARRGWKKLLPDWKETGVILMRTVDNG